MHYYRAGVHINFTLNGKPSPETWDAASKVCEGKSWKGRMGYLASVHSHEENAFILQLTDGNPWLGGSDLDTEGEWVWSDGTPWDFSPWGRDQPNNRFGNQDCTSMRKHGTWSDSNCAHKSGFVCKIKK